MESENTTIYIVAIALYIFFQWLRFRRNRRNSPALCPCTRRRNASRGSAASGGGGSNNNTQRDAAYREYLDRVRENQQQQSLEQRRSFILDSIVVQVSYVYLYIYV